GDARRPARCRPARCAVLLPRSSGWQQPCGAPAGRAGLPRADRSRGARCTGDHRGARAIRQTAACAGPQGPSLGRVGCDQAGGRAMSAIVLLDTSVYLNVLDVPGFNQDRGAVLSAFQAAIEAGDHFLLPLATVWETGNHIADLGDGQTRRRHGKKLLEDVTKAFQGYAPYRATHFPDRD